MRPVVPSGGFIDEKAALSDASLDGALVVEARPSGDERQEAGSDDAAQYSDAYESDSLEHPAGRAEA